MLPFLSSLFPFFFLFFPFLFFPILFLFFLFFSFLFLFSFFSFSFFADQISCRSYVGSAYRLRSLGVSGFSFTNFWTAGLYRSDTLRFLKHGSGHAIFKCLGWPCTATFIFCFRDPNRDTFGLLAPRDTWCGNACFGAQVSSKYGI